MTKLSRALMTGAVSLGLMACQAAPAPTPALAPAPVAQAQPAPAPAHDIAPAPQPVSATTPTHPGEAVYGTFCAACHDHPEGTRAPTKSTLQQMSLQFLNFSLTEGKMKAQAAAMSGEQRA